MDTPFSRSGFVLALSLFLLYSLVAAGVGLLLFVFTNLGRETTTTEVTDANGSLVSRTTEDKESVPVVVVFTALAAGGWLLIPLKFAWDELGKQSDSARAELAKRSEADRAELSKQLDAARAEIAEDAEYRREVAAKMRELVFGRIRDHFGPMLYRQLAVFRWAVHCHDATGDDDGRYERLLYAVARLDECYDQLADEGVPLVLRSVRAEQDAVRCNLALQDCLRALFGGDYECSDELVRALTFEAPSGRRFVPFVEFKRRLSGQDQQWARLRQIYSDFVAACRATNGLTDLIDCANDARNTLTAGLNEVYEEWYRAHRQNVTSTA